jgi:hypothetical protein
MKRRVAIKQELKRHVIGKKDIPSVKTSVYPILKMKKRKNALWSSPCSGSVQQQFMQWMII